MTSSSSLLRRSFLVVAALVLSALAGLAMAAPLAAVGANLLGRWLVGWAAAAALVLPLAWLAERAFRSIPQPARSAAPRPFRSRRLG
jgi:hypothetical protein